MKPDPLLDAVFGAQEDTLRPVLKAARRRRMRRIVVRAGCVAGCLAAVIWFLMPDPTARSRQSAHLVPVSPAPPVPGFSTVTTAAFPPLPTITTRPLTDAEVVQTKLDSVVTISTASTQFRPATIADAELFALFEPGRVALIGSGAKVQLVEY